MRHPRDIQLGEISRFRSEYMGVAIIIIILFHVALPRGDAFFGLRRMGNIGVDIFLFLSGMGMWYAWTKHETVTPGRRFSQLWASFYKRRLMRIYPTWLVIASLYYIPRYHHGWQLWADGHGIIDLLGDILINWDFWLHDELTFWYIPAIMMLYAFAPPFIVMVKRNAAFRWAVMLALAWTVAVQWVGPIHDAVGHIEIFWSRIPIFMIGICMGQGIKDNTTYGGTAMWLVWSVFILTLMTGIYMEQHLHRRFPLFIERLLYIPLTVTSLIVIGRWLMHAPDAVTRALSWVGAISLETYLIHSQFVLWRVEQLHIGYWGTFIVTAAVSLPLAWLMHRLMQRVTPAISKLLHI